METSAIKRWYIAVVAIFYTMSVGMTAVFTRMPEVKQLLGVDSAQLGILLLAGAAGSMSTLPFSGKLIARFGTKPLIMLALSTASVSIIALSIAAINGSVPLFAIFLFLTFAGAALTDVSVNVDGTQVEQLLKKSVMPRLHAFFSLGAFSGAGLATGAMALQIDLVTQTTVIMVISIAVPFALWKLIPHHTGQDLHHKDKTEKPKDTYSPWKNKIIPLLGLGILGMTIAEGATNDWLTLGFVEGLGQTTTNAGIAFVILQVGMVGSRFFGGALVDKIGRRRTLEVLAIVGIIGLLLVVFPHNIYLAWLGAAMWGAGVSMAFPLFLGAAGEGEHGAKNVGAVATFGYTAFLVGPPFLGLLAQNIGILNMFLVLVGCLAMSFFFARATSPQKV
jgi:MFS family permease